MESAVKYLASDELGGRLPGEPGNELAQDFFAASLKQMGYKSFDKNYRHEYTEAIVQLDSATLTLGDLAFTYPSALQPLQLGGMTGSDTLPLTDDPDVQHDAILLQPHDAPWSAQPNPHIKVLLREKRQDTRTMTIVEQDLKTQTRFYITQAAYDALYARLGEEASLSFSAHAAERTLTNVVAVRRAGEEPAGEAVVVSAHFDHLGASPFTGELFHGALDNASGSAALLSVARALAQEKLDGVQARDLYIAFFNSEEYMAKTGGGSAALAKVLETQYHKVYNVNLDCVGQTDVDTVSFLSWQPEGQALSRDVMRAAAEEGFVCEEKSGVMADHASFALGMTVTTGFDRSVINRTGDTLALVDFSSAERIAGMVAAYTSDLLVRPMVDLARYMDMSDLLEIPLDKKLKLNECMVTEYEGKLVHVRELFRGGNAFEHVPALAPFADMFYGGAALDLSLAATDAKQEICPVPFEPWQSCPTGLSAEEHEPGKVYASPIAPDEIRWARGLFAEDALGIAPNENIDFIPCALDTEEAQAYAENFMPDEVLGEHRGWSYGYRSRDDSTDVAFMRHTADGSRGYYAVLSFRIPGPDSVDLSQLPPSTPAPIPDLPELLARLDEARVFDLFDELVNACTP